MRSSLGHSQQFNYKKVLLQVVFGIISLVMLFVVAKLALRGAALPTTLRNIVLFSIMIMVLNVSKKAFWLIALPYVLLYALYLPIGMNFGPPSYKYFASVLATDGNEALEFFQQIPAKHYLYSLYIVVGIILFRIFTQRFDLRFAENKTVMIILVVIAMLPQAPMKHIHDIYYSVSHVRGEIQRLKDDVKHSKWDIRAVNPQYDTHVLVIGESARKDYLHAYGYPVKNTPFLDQSHGVFVDGLSSGGTNTISSLRLMLTFPDTDAWEPRYHMNFVDLANAAEFKTVWLSNQGMLGRYETPVAAIAKRSSEYHFTKKGGAADQNIDDDVLIPLLKNELLQEEDQKRLIVLHIYGSHPNPCERLLGYQPEMKVKDAYYNNIACYVTSIHKTDHFLQQVKEALDQYANTFDKRYSMIYFSDHGLAHKALDNQMLINNNSAVKQHYDIPLIKISSDDTERVVIKRQKSGLNFTKGLAHWMGIEAVQIPEAYDLFSDEDDEDDYGLSERLEKLKDDPAIDIREL